MRVGLGYDAHRLVPGRPLILGGVEIPHALGLLGHSDADVLSHAIGDALQDGAALGGLHLLPAQHAAQALGLVSNQPVQLGVVDGGAHLVRGRRYQPQLRLVKCVVS